MAKGKQVHTVPDSKGLGWKNTSGGETISRHHNKDTAVDAGRSTARKDGAEHVIHRRDGTIGEKNSYGNDKFPPRG